MWSTGVADSITAKIDSAAATPAALAWNCAATCRSGAYASGARINTTRPVRRSIAPCSSRRPIDTATTATEIVAMNSSAEEERNVSRRVLMVARRCGRFITLSLGPSIHPDQSGAHRLPVGVRRNQPVELRAERQRAHRGPVDGATYLGKRRCDGAEPLAWILLRPPRLRIGERVRHVSLRRLLALSSQRLGAGALRADIDPDNQLRLHSASSDSSPGPRR